jgi:uncharacterized protein (DUF2062 family)
LAYLTLQYSDNLEKYFDFEQICGSLRLIMLDQKIFPEAGVRVRAYPICSYSIADGRGNVLSAILATFFGNPLTFPFISGGSLWLGTFLLGRDFSEGQFRSSRNSFNEVMHELYENIESIFNSTTAKWSETSEFFITLWGNISEFINIFLFPYFVGGFIPGIVFGFLFYFSSVPIIAVYQNRRLGKIKQKWEKLKKRAGKVKIVIENDKKVD